MSDLSQQILDKVLAAGFDDARVKVQQTEAHELNVAHNHVSLMRSTDEQGVSISAIKDQRRVSASSAQLDDSAIQALIDQMLIDVASAPQDPAYAVAEGQQCNVTLGTHSPNLEGMAEATRLLLDARETKYPTYQMEEMAVKHQLIRTQIVTSKGTDLRSEEGHYNVGVMGSSKDEHGSSSFNYTGGDCNELPDSLMSVFGIERMIQNSVEETKAQPLGEKFTGDVVMMPSAVSDLFSWLKGQTSDGALMSESSMFKDSVGEQITDSQLTIRYGFEAPGAVPFNDEGFLVTPGEFLKDGVLQHLTPSLYVSRKLNLPHVPTGGTWEILPGTQTIEELQAGVTRGAVVSRLSMGNPASNGDFAGVIKNSFLLEDGKRTRPLSETMIAGNIAEMLKAIVGISQEVMDYGSTRLPWIRISGLKFS